MLEFPLSVWTDVAEQLLLFFRAIDSAGDGDSSTTFGLSRFRPLWLFEWEKEEEWEEEEEVEDVGGRGGATASKFRAACW